MDEIFPAIRKLFLRLVSWELEHVSSLASYDSFFSSPPSPQPLKKKKPIMNVWANLLLQQPSQYLIFGVELMAKGSLVLALHLLILEGGLFNIRVKLWAPPSSPPVPCSAKRHIIASGIGEVGGFLGRNQGVDSWVSCELRDRHLTLFNLQDRPLASWFTMRSSKRLDTEPRLLSW